MIAEIQCPNCHRKYDVDSRMIGRSVICAGKTCGLKFQAKAFEVTSNDEAIDLSPFENSPSHDKKLDIGPPPIPSRVRPDTGTAKGRPATERADEDETRSNRRRRTVLANLATIPGLIVLGCIVVAVLFYGNRFLQYQAKERAFATDALAYLATARKVVEAWPESPDTVVRLCDQLRHDLEEIKSRHAKPRRHYMMQDLHSIEQYLSAPSIFAKKREGKKTLTKVELEDTKHALHLEYVYADADVEFATGLINVAERILR